MEQNELGRTFMKYSYCTIYNFRPDETYGMGKESLKISGDQPLNVFLKEIQYNSSLKHENAIEFIVGTEESIEREDWKPWIGQPMFYVTDIKIEDETSDSN